MSQLIQLLNFAGKVVNALCVAKASNRITLIICFLFYKLHSIDMPKNYRKRKNSFFNPSREEILILRGISFQKVSIYKIYLGSFFREAKEEPRKSTLSPPKRF